MSMTGTIVNALAIVVSGAVGLLFQRGIPERVSKTVMIGLGLCVLYIGISGAFACQSILIVIVAMTLGAAAGALLNIDGAIHCLGTWVEAHVHRHEGGPSLAEGFVTASLLCCVGAMAVNGSLDAEHPRRQQHPAHQVDDRPCLLRHAGHNARRGRHARGRGGVRGRGGAHAAGRGDRAAALGGGGRRPHVRGFAARGGHRPQSDRRDED